MTAEKPTGVIDDIVDRNVTIDGKVYYAGEKVKPHLSKFHAGDTVTFTLGTGTKKGTIDTMFPSTVFGSQIPTGIPNTPAVPAGKPASATTAAPAGQPGPAPAPAPAPATKAAPVVPPVAASPKNGNGKLPQEMREERICRMSCLKTAVEMLKDQHGFQVGTWMAQENRVLETAQVFFTYAMNGTVPGEEPAGGGA